VAALRELLLVASRGTIRATGRCSATSHRGDAYKEVEHEDRISVRTVETHVSAVARKLQLSSRSELGGRRHLIQGVRHAASSREVVPGRRLLGTNGYWSADPARCRFAPDLLSRCGRTGVDRAANEDHHEDRY
jgi:hypothetical protein